MPTAREDPKAYHAAWRERNREKLKRKAAEYYALNREARRLHMVEKRRQAREQREWHKSAPLGTWSGLVA